MNPNTYHLKKGERKILEFIFRFRYLNRPQIQKLLKHKVWHRIILWLNELTEEGYIHRFYNRSFGGVPAHYCLNLKSRKYLETVIEKEQKPILRRLYKEKVLSQTFKEKCMLIADIFLFLEETFLKKKQINSLFLH